MDNKCTKMPGAYPQSRGCRNADVLRFIVSLGGSENMVGGAGGPARPRHDHEEGDAPQFYTFFHKT